MGEVITDVDSEICVRDEQSVLIEALKLMAIEDDLARGHVGSTKHYAWLNRASPDEWETGFDALADWRFSVVEEQEDVWTEVEFTSEKVGQEELLFERIEPYVDGYIEITTELDRQIRYEF